MRSIRLTLILSFLLLVAIALGAVSGLVYGTSAQTLYAKEQSTRELFQNQCDTEIRELRSALDRRIFQQAQTLASMTRLTTPRWTEGLYPFGVYAAIPQTQAQWFIPAWISDRVYSHIAFRSMFSRPIDFTIESPGDLLPEPHEGQPREFFQLFRTSGKSVLKSETLSEETLAVDDHLRKHDWQHSSERYDDVELPLAGRLRRVTIKATVFRQQGPFLSNFRWMSPGSPPPGQPPSRGGPMSPRMMPSSFGPKVFFPEVYIQYASDTSILDDQIAEKIEQRDSRIALVEEGTQKSLRELRGRLAFIFLTTFLATLVGGYFLVRIGLAPLERLSEAVSQVSEKDFRLKVEPDQLSSELQPIAQRLSRTLDQLGKAFEREKQAAADISHELRTPLAALLTALEVGLRKTRSSEDYREILRECRGSGQHMMVLVERLLALARLDAGAVQLKSRRVDAGELAFQCADLVRPLAEERGLTLRVHADGPAPLQTDPDKLREVLTNLLHNAIEYNKPSGSIDVAVQRQNGTMVYEVRDTGIGIAPELQDRIFERFYRADPSRHADAPHAGLGLAIVKSTIDLMGGSIRLSSGPDGSAFRIELPAHSEESP